MQSELSFELNLSVPTVKEHLNALEQAGLVERHDEGRKWKYYSLTKKGKAVLQPQETTILLVLGLFILSVIGGILTSIAPLLHGTPILSDEAVLAKSAISTVAPMSAQPAPILWPVYLFLLAAIVCVVVLGLLVSDYWHKRKMFRSLPH